VCVCTQKKCFQTWRRLLLGCLAWFTSIWKSLSSLGCMRIGLHRTSRGHREVFVTKHTLNKLSWTHSKRTRLRGFGPAGEAEWNGAPCWWMKKYEKHCNVGALVNLGCFRIEDAVFKLDKNRIHYLLSVWGEGVGWCFGGGKLKWKCRMCTACVAFTLALSLTCVFVALNWWDSSFGGLNPPPNSFDFFSRSLWRHSLLANSTLFFYFLSRSLDWIRSFWWMFYRVLLIYYPINVLSFMSTTI
jgi:hypothetical protein